MKPGEMVALKDDCSGSAGHFFVPRGTIGRVVATTCGWVHVQFEVVHKKVGTSGKIRLTLSEDKLVVVPW